MHPTYSTVLVCPSISPRFAQPKNTTGKIQPVKLVITLFCGLVLRLPEVHLFTSALVFQTYGISGLPQKVREKVSRPCKAPSITGFEVCSSCLLTCHLRHLTHIWMPEHHCLLPWTKL